jgi:poly-gamma-glutamate synthesis protein (capsule biosynthesis protein)
MHWRYIALSLVLFTVWQVIGVGYTPTTKEFAFGELLTQKQVNRTIKASPLTEARLSLVHSRHQYDSLVFVGDVLLARNVEFLMRTKGSEYPFAGLSPFQFSVHPALIGNFESAIPTEHQPTPIGQLNFSVSPQFVPMLSQSGFTHLSLANNHTNDFGEAGLVHTRSTLEKSLVTFGDPHTVSDSRVAKLQIHEQAISIIGIHALSVLDDEAIRAVLQAGESAHEYQIVYIHWGEEYALRHNQQQRNIAERLVEYGADLIIGHHPHVVQGIENIDGTLVFYSLGNYIFDQYFSKDVQEGLLLSIQFGEQSAIDLLPVTSQYSPSQPTLMSPKNHKAFLEQLARKSDVELQSAIRSGQLDLNIEIATSEKLAMMNSIHEYVQ